MKGRYLTKTQGFPIEMNIYADKSSLILEWILTEGISTEFFSLREIMRDTGVSIGLVQKVLSQLAYYGVLKVQGLRTAKKYRLYNPRKLIDGWLENYSIIKKCKMWNYSTGFATQEKLMSAIKDSDLKSKLAFALHSAADAYSCKFTNLNTIEFYLLDIEKKNQVEDLLQLEEQERGYKVLLIQPYYKSMLKRKTSSDIAISPPLLTFLDLYHYPLRGIEQAEHMANKLPQLKMFNL